MDIKLVSDTEYMKILYDAGSSNLLDDSDESEEKWNRLKDSFRTKYKDYSDTDYEFADWHHGVLVLYVYLYNEEFYSKEFLENINSILKDNGNCLAEFECFNRKDDMIGIFLVYNGVAYFDHDSCSKELINACSGYTSD